MKKVLFVVIALAVLFMLSAQPAKAQNISEDTKTGVDLSKPQELGNKICPVTGEKINELTKATYEYEGKIYNFCCAMCIDDFKKDPQKYIKEIEAKAQ